MNGILQLINIIKSYKDITKYVKHARKIINLCLNLNKVAKVINEPKYEDENKEEKDKKQSFVARFFSPLYNYFFHGLDKDILKPLDNRPILQKFLLHICNIPYYMKSVSTHTISSLIISIVYYSLMVASNLNPYKFAIGVFNLVTKPLRFIFSQYLKLNNKIEKQNLKRELKEYEILKEKLKEKQENKEQDIDFNNHKKESPFPQERKYKPSFLKSLGYGFIKSSPALIVASIAIVFAIVFPAANGVIAGIEISSIIILSIKSIYNLCSSTTKHFIDTNKKKILEEKILKIKNELYVTSNDITPEIKKEVNEIMMSNKEIIISNFNPLNSIFEAHSRNSAKHSKNIEIELLNFS